MSRQLYRIRDKRHPKIPRTNIEVQEAFKKAEIFEEYGKTLNKIHPLYVDSIIEEEYAFHVFASFANIKLTEAHIPPGQRKYLMDGTFKVVPRLFGKKGQLLIIAIEYKNDVSINISHLFIIDNFKEDPIFPLTHLNEVPSFMLPSIYFRTTSISILVPILYQYTIYN